MRTSGAATDDNADIMTNYGFYRPCSDVCQWHHYDMVPGLAGG